MRMRMFCALVRRVRQKIVRIIVRLKRDGTRAETRFCLSPKQTSPFKSARALVQSTAGSRGVRISVSNAGYTTFRGSVRVLATHSIHHFPLHFPSCASPCAIRFQTHSTLYACVYQRAGDSVYIIKYCLSHEFCYNCCFFFFPQVSVLSPAVEKSESHVSV